MTTKYNFNIDFNILEINIKRLTNQLWKLIPMREHDEDWNKQLQTVTIEIAGLNELFCGLPQFLTLLAKLEGLSIIDIDFSLYRKTVFETISLLQELKKDGLV